MKTTKQISMLILLAFLSFSCKEDESTDENDDDNNNVELSNNPEDYMPQENSVYTYTEFNYSGSQATEHEYKFYNHSFVDYKGYDALHVEMEYFNANMAKLKDDDYIRVEGSKLYYSTNVLVNNLSLQFQTNEEELSKYISDWYLVCDFEKDSWQSVKFEMPFTKTENGLTYSGTIFYEINCTKMGEDEITVNGKKYKGFKIKQETHYKDEIVIYGQDMSNEMNIISTVSLFEGVGFGKNEYKPEDNPMYPISKLNILKSIN